MTNKLFNMSLIILIGIALLGAVAVVLWQTTVSGQREVIVDENRLSADQFLAQSVQTEEITTNLKTNNFIIVKFNVLMDSKKSKEEFEKRAAQAQSIIISTLSSLSPEELQGEEGIQLLEELLIEGFNEVMQLGRVIGVRTIDLKIQ
ncbi:flagellar basal body-associated FliL family protein [Bacillus horti]|uniref:Flagellar protein FliL n=1 Tax=Caldalkalibacillus horti TaxID=77523 RepID=A0ABT9VUK3_9BACI|nr:flagellar basal body-associated FliL family protein [Bacillus horti]MDQ0164671.1 flagellar FliL protein [Bacillus horti]